MYGHHRALLMVSAAYSTKADDLSEDTQKMLEKIPHVSLRPRSMRLLTFGGTSILSLLLPSKSHLNVFPRGGGGGGEPELDLCWQGSRGNRVSRLPVSVTQGSVWREQCRS